MIHGTNQASKANLIQLPAMIAGGVLGGGGSLLQYGGSAEAQEHLLRSFERFKEEPGHPMLSGVEYGFTEALLKANGWVLSKDGI